MVERTGLRQRPRAQARARTGQPQRGVAVHKSFNTYVAEIAEVSIGEDGAPKVHKVWCAVDCGVAVNPNIIRAQMEGGIGYGLGAILYDEITLGDGGRVVQSNFHGVPVQMPHLVQSDFHGLPLQRVQSDFHRFRNQLVGCNQLNL